jgi:hypothetical protein
MNHSYEGATLNTRVLLYFCGQRGSRLVMSSGVRVCVGLSALTEPGAISSSQNLC